MRLIVERAFLFKNSHFFIKNKKAGPREKRLANLCFFLLLARSSTCATDRRHFLQPNFVIQVLKYSYELVDGKEPCKGEWDTFCSVCMANKGKCSVNSALEVVLLSLLKMWACVSCFLFLCELWYGSCRIL